AGRSAERGQTVEIPDGDRLLGGVDVVGLELRQKRERGVVGEGAVGIDSQDDAVAEAVAERHNVGEILSGIDADLQPEVAKAALVERLRRFHELGDAGLHRQQSADTHTVAAFAAQELVNGEADRLAGDVVERVGDGRLGVERVVERLVQGVEDAAYIEGRSSGDQRLEVV